MLKEYDATVTYIASLRHRASELAKETERLEDKLLLDLRLDFHSRDHGFPGWSCDGVGYYDTTREALVAMRTKKGDGDGDGE